MYRMRRPGRNTLLLETIVFFQHRAQLIVRQRNHAMIVDARHGVGGDHGVDDGLLGGLNGRRENGFDPVVGEHFKVDDMVWSSGPGLAVENATKMSPDPFPEMLPSRPNASETLRATRFS